ncbi:MAG: hypothetical protein NTV05_15955 [Acidobacteria bacterium]|nr:hypothetical protein [Acidobacteriota bacterium]
MRSLTRHGWIRCATLFLLAWISVDLAWPDFCAADVFSGDCPASCLSHHNTSPPNHSGLLHPDHCFCHAHSITLSAGVLIVEPPRSSAVDPFCLDFIPAASIAQLYHPPQHSR